MLGKRHFGDIFASGSTLIEKLFKLADKLEEQGEFMSEVAEGKSRKFRSDVFRTIARLVSRAVDSLVLSIRRGKWKKSDVRYTLERVETLYSVASQYHLYAFSVLVSELNWIKRSYRKEPRRCLYILEKSYPGIMKATYTFFHASFIIDEYPELVSGKKWKALLR